MKVAALYDVHAMPWALEAVLAEVDAERPDVVVFGGDYLYGPYPRETVASIRALDARGPARQLRGPRRGRGSGRARPGELAWLQSLPLAATVDDVVYCHATPRATCRSRPRSRRPTRCSRRSATRRGTVVIGHTHHQFDRSVDGLRVVNAGSVGMAYEGEVAAFWAILDDGEPSFRRTPFDVERAIAETRASAWPHAQGFVDENLLVAVDRDEAIASLESRRT